ncbi:MAG TPA: Uma2 family endonuclease [Urbifossiella sp.]|jgi:Uma2 family endonuclease|nr:Uma2 family endonuclease [Urbifossiella sp.]
MSATTTRSRYPTLADVARRVGDVSLQRIRTYPLPGTATANDLLDPAVTGDRLCELVGGVIVEKAMGWKEGGLGLWIGSLLNLYLMEHNIGYAAGADGMVRFNLDLVRLPDVSFIRWDSVDDPEAIENPGSAFLEVAPDLVVEVLSPGNTRREMAIKLGEYAKAGVRLVWYVDPERKEVDVYPKARAKGKVTVGVGGELDGGPVLPGFTLPVAKLFEKRAPAGRKGGKSPKGKPKKG